MKRNILIASSMAILCLGSVAHGADTPVWPEPDSLRNVSVCDAYGKGYYYIPGTETCLRLHGYIRDTLQGGGDVNGRNITEKAGTAVYQSSNRRKSWDNSVRFTLRASTASETELGTLETFAEARFQWDNGTDADSTGTLQYGYINLGGLRIGLDQSVFVSFVGALGEVNNDDVILAGGYRTGLISYTYSAPNGVSAIVSLEQGNNKDTDGKYGYDGTITGYSPHIVAGLKYAQGWGSIITVAAYDARNQTWAGKLRGNFNLTDRLSLWAMAGYKSNKDPYMDVKGDSDQFVGRVRAINSFYGQWGGDWAAWGGLAYKMTKSSILNAELAVDGSQTIYTTANVAYELVPGFTINPEVSYVHRGDKKSLQSGTSSWQGLILFQRTF
jgi:hypothetical protein